MRKLLPLLLALIPAFTYAQEELNVHHYPQHLFRNPLNIPIYLAGNFGECRPGHFHSGDDIKTLGKEGQPVYAAADGYISRIKMEKGGFGHAIYITHPEGYTTLYAHLSTFVPKLQEYLRRQQYEKERWDVDLQFSPGTFPVKKGQQIAWSGNTGGSTAPHLHFEIRDTKTEHPLNPEMFGLPIVDNIPPKPKAIAVYDLKQSIYEQDPKIMALKKGSNTYTLSDADTLITDAGLAGIGVNVDDYMNGSDNTIAFYTMELLMDDSIQAEVRLDDIGYDETRYVNAYADYKTHEQKKEWFQCLFRLPGNELGHIFENINVNNGGLSISDNSVHKIKIKITDDKGNVSLISFYLRSSGDFVAHSNCDNLFKCTQSNSFEQPNVKFSLDNKTIYDDICFKYQSTPDATDFSNKYQIHYSYVPVHHSFDLYIKPNTAIPFELRDKIAMMYSDGRDEDGRGAVAMDHGWYKAGVRNFGSYWLVADTAAPVIKPMQKENSNLAKAKQITFVVKDAISSVRKFKGELDGKWICFEQHNDLFFYQFDKHCPKGKHKLIFTATDENNNTATYALNFTR